MRGAALSLPHVITEFCLTGELKINFMLISNNNNTNNNNSLTLRSPN